MPNSISTFSRVTFAIIVTFFVASFAMTTTANAVKPVRDDEVQKKVSICHSNESNDQSGKPYTTNSVAVEGLNGHGDHTGDDEAGVVWNGTIHETYKDGKITWGDIIPPTGEFPGLNWNNYGQAVYANDCKYVESVEAKPVVFVAPTCTAKGTYTVPETEGVEYSINDKVVEAGTYTVDSDANVTVTAHALKGYVLEAESDAEWSYDFVTPTNCDEPTTPGVVLGSTTTATPQVTATPAGAVNAGGAGTIALTGLLASTGIFSMGAIIRKFQA